MEILRAEHSESKSEAQLPSEVSLDAAGAAFASLILTGNEAISRKSIINLIDGELPISEVKQLPGTEKIDLDQLRFYLSSSIKAIIQLIQENTVNSSKDLYQYLEDLKFS